MITRKESGAFLNGILWGGAIGAMGALLVAPKSGKRVRRDIARRGRRLQRHGEDMKFRTEETVAELIEKGNDAAETVRDAASRAQKRVKKAASSMAG